MEGLFDFLKSASSNSLPAGVVIAVAALLVGVLVIWGLTKFFAPIGEGAGHMIAKTGDAIGAVGEGVGAIGQGVGRTVGGPGALMEGMAEAAVQRAKNEEESFTLKLEDGLGRTVFVQAHGHQTAPKMPEVMGGVPMLPAPPAEAVLQLASPKKKGRK